MNFNFLFVSDIRLRDLRSVRADRTFTDSRGENSRCYVQMGTIQDIATESADAAEARTSLFPI